MTTGEDKCCPKVSLSKEVTTFDQELQKPDIFFDLRFLLFYSTSEWVNSSCLLRDLELHSGQYWPLLVCLFFIPVDKQTDVNGCDFPLKCESWYSFSNSASNVGAPDSTNRGIVFDIPWGIPFLSDNQRQIKEWRHRFVNVWTRMQHRTDPVPPCSSTTSTARPAATYILGWSVHSEKLRKNTNTRWLVVVVWAMCFYVKRVRTTSPSLKLQDIWNLRKSQNFQNKKNLMESVVIQCGVLQLCDWIIFNNRFVAPKCFLIQGVYVQQRDKRQGRTLPTFFTN